MKLLVFLLMAGVLLFGCAKENEISKNQIETSENIIGGSSVRAGSTIARTVVGLTDGRSRCTASIVSEDLLLTAKHCVKSTRNLTALFGLNMTRPNSRRRITSVEKHPYVDIAMVQFEGGLPAGYKPSKVLTDFSEVYAGKKVTLAGYGVTGMTRAGKMSTPLLRVVQTNVSDPDFRNGEYVMMDQRQNKGACHGDSGGPSYVERGGEHYLFGVTSRGWRDPYDTCLKFSLYVKIHTYWSWVKKAVNKISKHGKFGQIKVGPAKSAPIKRRPPRRSTQMVTLTTTDYVSIRKLVRRNGRNVMVEVSEVSPGTVIKYDRRSNAGRQYYQDVRNGRIRFSRYGWYRGIKVVSGRRSEIAGLRNYQTLYMSVTAR